MRRLFIILFLLLMAGVLVLLNRRIDDNPHLTESVSVTVEEPSSVTLPPASEPSPVVTNSVIQNEDVQVAGDRPEDRLLKDAELLESDEIERGGKRVRRSLYRTDFKYPIILVEEVSDEPHSRAVMVGSHVMMKFPVAMSADEVQHWVDENGFSVIRKMRMADIYLIGSDVIGVGEVERLIAAFKESFPEEGAVVESDHIATIDAVPNDPSYNQLWGMEKISAPAAWNFTTGSRDVLVGVVDSGIDYTHPDLAENIWVNPGEIADNGIDDDGNGFIDDIHGWDFVNDDNDPVDDAGHGTHCAGTVGAVGDNGIGVAGANWNVSIAALKFIRWDGRGATSDAVEALHYAIAQGMDLTSNSWGSNSYNSLLYRAISLCGQSNMLFVASAGNDYKDNDRYPYYPAGMDLDNIVTVAASDPLDQKSSFSNYGLVSVDLAAPGSQIYSTLLNGTYGSKSGTSMAAPHVAGAAALMLSIAPEMPYAEIKALLMDHVDPVEAFEARCVSGGRLNLYESLAQISTELINVASYAIEESPSANGDGIPNPGETFALELEVINDGYDWASNTVVSVQSGTPEFIVESESINIGTLRSGETAPNSPVFEITTLDSLVTPTDEVLQVRFDYVTAGDERIRIVEIPVSIYTSSVLSGRVVNGGRVPLAGAVVHYAGTFEGEVLTDEKGYYSVILPDGEYDVQVSLPGYYNSDIRALTLPPDQSDINFILEYAPVVAVAPLQIDAVLVEESSEVFPIEISNPGNLPLEWEVGSIIQQRTERYYQSELSTAEISDPDVEDSVSADRMDLTGLIVGTAGIYKYVHKEILSDIRRRGGTVQEFEFPLTAEMLDDADILLCDEYIGNAGESDVAAIRAWIDRGGSVLLQPRRWHGDEGAFEKNNAVLAGSGIIQREYPVTLSQHSFADHPINKGVEELMFSYVSSRFEVEGSAVGLVRDAVSNILVAAAPFGRGRMIIFGDDILNDEFLDIGDQRLFANNIISWLGRIVPWLNASSQSGTVPPGESRTVELQLSTEKLDADTEYLGQIIIASNDPKKPETIIDINLEVLPHLTVGLVLPEGISEASGVAPDAGSVFLNRPVSTNVVVQLSSSSVEAGVPAEVIIPAGKTNAVFDISVTDDAQLDGPLFIDIEASAAGCETVSGSFLIYDDESATLTLTAPQTTFEGAGSVACALSLNPVPDRDVTVQILSTHHREIAPTNIVVPTGTGMMNFDLSVADDNVIDEVQAVVITAHVENWEDSSISIFVMDNESTALSVKLPKQVSESVDLQEAVGTVSIDGTVLVDTHILLESSDVTEATVPSFVTIPAGASSAEFEITTVDDEEQDGKQIVTITGSAPGLVPGLTTMDVLDNEVHHFEFGPIATQQVDEVPFNISIHAEAVDGNPITLNSFVGFNMTRIDSNPYRGRVTAPRIPFINGRWSGDVAIDWMLAGEPQLALTVFDPSSGVSGTSTPFTVVWSDIVFSPSLLDVRILSDEMEIHNVVVTNAGTVDVKYSIPLGWDTPDGFVAHYSLDGNSMDASGNGLHGMAENAWPTVDRFGRVDGAYAFPGIRDAGVDLEFGGRIKGSFSAGLWFRIDSEPNSDSSVACLIGDDWGGVNLWRDNFLGETYFGFSDYTGELWSPPVSRLEGWNHLSVVCDFPGQILTWYLNGQVFAAVDFVQEDVILATDFLGSGFEGAMDDVQIYDRALTAEEVEALYLSGSVVSAGIESQPVQSSEYVPVGEEPGLEVISISGTLSPGSSTNLSFRFNAKGLGAGANWSQWLNTGNYNGFSKSLGCSMRVVVPAPVMDPEPGFTLGKSNMVSWSEVDGAGSYWVERAIATNSDHTVSSGWISSTNHLFMFLNTGMSYYYRAKANIDPYSEEFESDWSDWVWSEQVVDLTDFDGDGIPNWWEEDFFGGARIALSSDDPDGDGQSNLDEYIAGMDPTNYWSTFMVTAAETPTNGDFIIYWDSVTGRVYTVCGTTNLTESMNQLQTDIRHPQNSYTNPAGESGFYSIEVELDR